MHPVVTITDDKYLPGTMVMIESLLQYVDSIQNLYIVYDKDRLSKKSMLSLANFVKKRVIKIKFVSSNKYEIFKAKATELYKDDFLDKGWNASIFLQAFLGDAIADEDIVFYIDSDTIFLQDPQPLLSTNPKLPIMAQIDYGVGTQFSNNNIPYFNAGVFITSLNYWRDNDFAFEISNEKDLLRYRFHGQDFLNEKFYNNWQLLGPQVNVARECISIEDTIKELKILRPENFIFHAKPTLVHYFGSPKPWMKEYTQSILENWRSGGSLNWVDFKYFEILDKVSNFI